MRQAKRAGGFSPQFLAEIKKLLLGQEKRLVKEKEQVAKEDPYLDPERSSAKIAEIEEAASEEIGHERVEAEKGVLERILAGTRLALTKLKRRKYGICENCGRRIDPARLKAFPQARLCLDCKGR